MVWSPREIRSSQKTEQPPAGRLYKPCHADLHSRECRMLKAWDTNGDQSSSLSCRTGGAGESGVRARMGRTLPIPRVLQHPARRALPRLGRPSSAGQLHSCRSIVAAGPVTVIPGRSPVTSAPFRRGGSSTSRAGFRSAHRPMPAGGRGTALTGVLRHRT